MGDLFAHDLPGGDGHADGPQLRHQARHRDLPLMILGQHKAAQFGPKVTINPARRRHHDQVPLRCQPALPAIADTADPQDQVLNDEVCVALKPRAGWHRGLDKLVFDGYARPHRTAAALAPKLLVALWKYVTAGVPIGGAVLKPA